jgi:hypothetical protein
VLGTHLKRRTEEVVATEEAKEVVEEARLI